MGLAIGKYLNIGFGPKGRTLLFGSKIQILGRG